MWLMGERLATGFLALTVTTAVARYLGPVDFGLVNYSLSIVMLVGTFWTLGLSGLVVREIVRRPGEEPQIQGTVLAFRAVGSVIALVAVYALTVVLGDEPLVRTTATVLAVGVVTLYLMDGIDFGLQARLRSKAAVVARLSGLAASSALLIAFILFRAPFMWFVLAIAAEYVIGGLGMVAAYRVIGGRLSRWRFNRRIGGQLLISSWPLLLAGIANAINLRVDQIMLGSMVGNEAVGTYAAAARLSEVWYFVPTAIAASTFPGLVALRDLSEARYTARIQWLYDVVVSLAVPVALVISILSGPIISTLYGPEYAASAGILAVHVWTGPFVFMAAILSRWLLAENRLWYSLGRHGTGAIVNVALNLVLIPALGGLGAAIATLVSYAVASYFACFIFPATRGQAIMMTWSLLLPVRMVRRWVWRPGVGSS